MPSLQISVDAQWTGPGIILDPNNYSTYVVLPVGSRGVYTLKMKDSYSGCEGSCG